MRPERAPTCMFYARRDAALIVRRADPEYARLLRDVDV